MYFLLVTVSNRPPVARYKIFFVYTLIYKRDVNNILIYGTTNKFYVNTAAHSLSGPKIYLISGDTLLSSIVNFDRFP